MKLFRTRRSRVLSAVIAVAMISAASYPLYRIFERPIREALGLPPRLQILSFDVDKYSVELKGNAYAKGSVLISRGTNVWNLEGWRVAAYEFSTGSFFCPDDHRLIGYLLTFRNPILSKDINSDGYPEVIIMREGATNGTSVYVLRLGNQIDLLLRLSADFFDLRLSDEDNDGNMELLVPCCTFLWGSFGGSSSSDVPIIYKWRNGSYYVATPEFYAKYAPLIEEKVRAYPAALEKARSTGFTDGFTPHKVPPEQMWEIVRDYVYLGEGVKAREAFDRLWPPEVPGKDEALFDFDESLTDSAFWKDIDNGTAPPKRWPPVNPQK